MSTIVSFGEVLMRLSPSNYERIIQSQMFEARYSGAEANVATSLAYYGDKVRFISKFPDNVLGEAAENSIRHFGVDTSYCVKGGERLGTYYTEKGASQRASTVLYDRKGSSFALSTKQEYNWKEIFKIVSGSTSLVLTLPLVKMSLRHAWKHVRLPRKWVLLFAWISITAPNS